MNKQVYEITQNIFEEAAKGNVVIRTKTPGAHWYYRVHFFTDIGEERTITDENYPILKVSNMENLINEIERYLVYAEPFINLNKNFLTLATSHTERKLFLTFLSVLPHLILKTLFLM